MIKLSHAVAREHIQQLADGEALSTEARLALNHHLADCAACRTYAQEIRALHVSLTHTFRARWEKHAVPQRVRLNLVRRPTPTWKPLLQTMAMLAVVFMALNYLPAGNRLPAAPLSQAPTQTVSAPAAKYLFFEEGFDEALESLTSGETTVRAVSVPGAPAAEADPFFKNYPDTRAVRAQ